MMRNKSSAIRILIAFAAANLLAPAVANGQESSPILAGDLTFRGDSWPVELATVEDGGPGREGLLTLPDLVYADEPVETRSAGGAIVVTFPFGLGDYALEPEGDSAYVGRSALGGDTAVLRLRPSEPSVVRRPVGFESGDVARCKGTVIRGFSPLVPSGPSTPPRPCRAVPRSPAPRR